MDDRRWRDEGLGGAQGALSRPTNKGTFQVPGLGLASRTSFSSVWIARTSLDISGTMEFCELIFSLLRRSTTAILL